MFERLRLQGSSSEGIVLETHQGRRIDNQIELPPNQQQIAKYKRLLANHGRWIERRPATGSYNCVGHVWASRRTSVFGPDLEDKVLAIFQDDGYRVLDWPAEPLHPGDLVTYWESPRERKMFFHVGVVFELRQLQGSKDLVPWVLSKWDSISGEVFHHYSDHPFLDYVPFLEKHKYKVEPEFWTDRP